MLISISTVVVGLFLFLYLRAIHSGQYEDVESPAIRMLFEDELITPPAQESPEEKNIIFAPNLTADECHLYAHIYKHYSGGIILIFVPACYPQRPV